MNQDFNNFNIQGNGVGFNNQVSNNANNNSFLQTNGNGNIQSFNQPNYNENNNLNMNYQYGQNNNFNGSSNNNQKKNRNWIIIIGILVSIILISVLVLFINKNNSDDKASSKDKENQIIDDSSENDKEQEKDDSSDTSKEEEKDDDSGILKQNVNIATIGHVDHGKTTLTSAITKLYGKYVSYDEILQKNEEIKNGYVYNVSRVEYETKTRHYTHFDFPGHIDFISGMISRSVDLDGAILVVSATDGIMAQSREHIKILSQLGINRIVVYMSKCDLVDDKELLDLIEMEIRELLIEYGFDGYNTPVVKGSALKAIEGDKEGEKSIHDLMTAVDQWIEVPINDTNISVSPYNTFDAYIYMYTREEGGRHTPIFNNYKASINFDSLKANGIFVFPEGTEMIMPGDNVEVSIKLDSNIQLTQGSKFEIHDGEKVIGVGFIIKPSE